MTMNLLKQTPVTNDDSVFCNSCETCDKIFNYNNDIRDDMCDACIVIIADKENIIRYVDFVPGGGLPNINKALKAASDLLKLSKTKG